MEPNTRCPQMFPGTLPTLCSFPPLRREHEVRQTPSFLQPRPDAHPPANPRCRTPVPTRALTRPPEKPVTAGGPPPLEDKLPVNTMAFQGIHITGKTKVPRSRGIALKLFIVRFLLSSPPRLSPTLFCQPATRATVSLHPVSTSGRDCK